MVCNNLVKSEIIKGTEIVCADHMRQCHLSQPCCNQNHVCKSLGRGALLYDRRCIEQATLGGICTSNFDCDGIDFSMCSENNICECQKGFVTIENSKCLSPLSNFCLYDSHCVTNNSICINFRCKCKPDFMPTSNDHCKPTFAIKGFYFCEQDSDCADFMHAKCSENKNCVCRANNVVMNGTCVPSINGFCWNNERCATENSICIDSTCQCKPGFKFSPRFNSCLKSYLGKPCNKNSDCEEIKNGECSIEKHCVCKENRPMLNEVTCATTLNGYCNDDAECLPINSACIDNECKCKPKFIADENSECILAELGMPCKSTVDCMSLHHSECKNCKCVCETDTLFVNQTACLSLIGGYCFSHEDCLPINSVCVSDRCECKPEYMSTASNICILERFVVNCTNNKDCGDEMRKSCNSNNKCICKNSFAIGTSECKSLVGGYCTNSEECMPVNSVCIIDECQCKSTINPISRNQCHSSYQY